LAILELVGAPLNGVNY